MAAAKGEKNCGPTAFLPQQHTCKGVHEASLSRASAAHQENPVLPRSRIPGHFKSTHGASCSIGSTSPENSFEYF
jgi:hypothetical protein